MTQIIAQYSGNCVVCGEAITPGEQIEHVKGQPTRHARCTPPEVPANAIRVGGGSGYGYRPYTPGSVIRNAQHRIDSGEPEWLYVLTASRQCICEDGMSFWVGDESGYLYSAVCRSATAEEAAPLIAQREEAQRITQKRELLAQIFDQIVSSGEYPTGDHLPEGQRVDVRPQDLYGGGRWFVIGPDYVWAVINNGADGDDWSFNNVRTGGAGAIGRRVPTAPDLVSRILENADDETVSAIKAEHETQQVPKDPPFPLC